MTYLDAVLLGIVEGLTEFLPISSTGHMILANRLMGLTESEQLKAFEVIIQSGAILAVIWHYRIDFKSIFGGLARGERRSKQVVSSIFIAFLPAMIFGALFSKKIKEHLFGVESVAWALLVGGVVMLLLEKMLKSKKSHLKFDEVPVKQSLIIGLSQCLALWPGFSRAMATILGARAVGLSTKHAAEYSFLLAVPTLFAAAAHDAIKVRASIFETGHDFGLFAVGLTVSFVTALVVIRGFLKFLTSHSMQVFGWYRIVIGVGFLLMA